MGCLSGGIGARRSQKSSKRRSVPVPEALGNLTNLRGLVLSSNQLSGSIPTELGSLANLEGLYLSDNELLLVAVTCLCLPAAGRQRACVRAQVGGVFTAVDSAEAMIRSAPSPPAWSPRYAVATCASTRTGLAPRRLSPREPRGRPHRLTLNLFDDAVFSAAVTGPALTSSGG